MVGPRRVKSLNRQWKKYGIVILLVFSIVFLLCMIVYLNAPDIVPLTGTKDGGNSNEESRKDEDDTKDDPTFSGILKGLKIPIQQKKKKRKRRLPQESKGELECRRSLQSIFGKPFYKVRPDFLTNPYTNKPLELDCYNDELKVAVEMQGEGHYHYLPVFHKSYQDFTNQQYRDALKRVRCKEMGIKLVEVPYTVKLEDIENYIRERVNKV